MASKEKSWARWNEYRSDIVRAAELAKTTIKSWNSAEPNSSVRLVHDDGLTEDEPTLDALTGLHRYELHGLRAVWVSVEPDFDAWSNAAVEARRQSREPPKRPQGSVRIRLTRGGGMTLKMQGEERDRVQGLTADLAAILARGAPLFHRVDPALVAIFLVFPLLAAAFFLGPLVTQWVGASERDGQYDTWEIVGLIVGFALAVLIPLGIWRAFPTMEVLDDGELSRYRRLRQVVGTVVGALLVGVASAGLYDLIR